MNHEVDNRYLIEQDILDGVAELAQEVRTLRAALTDFAATVSLITDEYRFPSTGLRLFSQHADILHKLISEVQAWREAPTLEIEALLLALRANIRRGGASE